MSKKKKEYFHEDVVIPIERARELANEMRSLEDRFNELLQGSRVVPFEKRSPVISLEKWREDHRKR